MLRLRIGEVVDNKDPLFQGRVKVSLPSIVEEPFWVLPLFSDNYSFTVPEVGSRVLLVLLSTPTGLTGYYLGQIFDDLPKQFIQQEGLCLYPLYNKKFKTQKFEYDPDSTQLQSRFKIIHRDEFLTEAIYSLPISKTRQQYDQDPDLHDFKDKTIAYTLSNRSSWLEFKTQNDETVWSLNLHAPYKKIEDNKWQCKTFTEDFANSTTKLLENLNAKQLVQRQTVLQIYDDTNKRVLNEITLDSSHAEYKLVLTHQNTTVYIEAKNNGQVIIKCKEATIQAASSVTINTPQTSISGNVSIGGNLSVAGNIDCSSCGCCP